MHNAMRSRFTKTQDDIIVKIVLESGLPLIRSSFKMAFWKDHMTNFPSRDALAVQRRLNLLWDRPDVQGKLTSRTEDITESEKKNACLNVSDKQVYRVDGGTTMSHFGARRVISLQKFVGRCVFFFRTLE